MTKGPSIPSVPSSVQAPSSAQFQSQLQQQYAQSQQSLNQQLAQFQQQQNQNALLAAQNVANQQASINGAVNAATQVPVTMQTLLSSPRGILGNPSLSYTKLGG